MTKSVATAILSFTEIANGEHQVFNRWHRYDHQPDQYLNEGVVAGARLVAPPALQARRIVTDDVLAATQYFGYYFISEPVEKTFKDMGASAARDKARGRWYERRGPSSTNRVAHMYASPSVLSDPAVMPFRPHQGVFVTVDDPKSGASTKDLDIDFAFHEELIVQSILNLRGVAGCWSFEYHAVSSFPGMAAEIPNRRATRIYWLDGEPGAFLDALGENSSTKQTANQLSYESVFRGAYTVIPPESQFNWFDG